MNPINIRRYLQAKLRMSQVWNGEATENRTCSILI